DSLGLSIMSSLLSYLPVINRLVGSHTSADHVFDISPLEAHNIETNPDRCARRLKHLIKANHANYSILYHNFEFHNHNAYILASAYLLGANEDQLRTLYDKQVGELEPWAESPCEITEEDWIEYLGDGGYQRAFVDFFEDQLVMRFSYDWKKLLENYMFQDKRPLISGLFGGLGHPLIHLGYAYEINSKELAIEALAMSSVQFSYFHKYLDNPRYTKPSSFSTYSLAELLEQVRGDDRFSNLFPKRQLGNIDLLFEKHEDLVLEYWNAWEIRDPEKQLEECQETAVSLLVATVAPGTHSYNYLLVHVLTTSHAVRVLLPLIPARFHTILVRGWVLYTLSIFIALLRPQIDPDYVDPSSILKGRHWTYVEQQALTSPWSADAHFVEAIRAIRTVAQTWGDVHERYLAAAVRFVDDFHGWTFTDRPICLTLIHDSPLVRRPSFHPMAPPAKRRRKNVVEASDEEPDRPQDNLLTRFLNSSPANPGTSGRGPTTSPSPLKKRTLGALNSKNGANLSPSPSPEKRRSQKKVKVEEKGKTADLLTLFSKQVQKSQASATLSRAKTSPADEITSDPISDDEDVSYHKAHASSIVGEKAKKRLWGGSQKPLAPNPTQMFVRPSKPTRPSGVDDDLRPWSERFGPVNLEELAVHKKKVTDVRRWIEGVLSGQLRQRILLLKGAAGTGKTTTVRLLADDMGCELLEWKSPLGSFVPGMQSPSAQFEAFLGFGGKFGGLELESSGPEDQPTNIGLLPDAHRRVILIEEFPNTFTRSSSALTSFRNALLAYLNDNTPSLSDFARKVQKPVAPIIMVISETLLTTTSASADSFTAHRLLGPEIMRHPGTGLIEFNAIAPSLLTKALELVVLKEARKSGRRRTPGPQVLKRLGEIGDIRSAVSSLEFLCLKGDQDADWGAKVSFTKQKRTVKDSVALTRGEKESLEQITQREASLGIFHAVGKVVYNKRDEPSATGDCSVESLPSYLRLCARPKRSQVEVDSLIDEIGADTGTFISALHENYALSCDSGCPDDAKEPIDYINGCIDSLSDSDLLYPSWDSFFGGKGTFAAYFSRDTGSHIVRQDEMAFQVAVRGILFALPHPVKRIASGASKSSDTFKMFYPTSLKLWRAKEEMEGLVDVWSTKLLNGEDHHTHNGRAITDGANLFLRTSRNHHQSPSKSNPSRHIKSEEGSSVPLLSLGSAARRELLLERLPYMALIGRARKKAPLHNTLRQRDIEKVVSFRGIGVTPDDEAVVDEAEEAIATGEAWATDRPTEEASPKKKEYAGIKARGSEARGLATSVAGLQVQKLVLSDDDIESD
ncbi:hypothetical protein jhhlp_007278, partial [Lomentospora prolificans]